MNALRFSDLPGPGLGILQELARSGIRDTSGNGIPAFKVRHQKRESPKPDKQFRCTTLSFRPLDLAFGSQS